MKYTEQQLEIVKRELKPLMCIECFECLYDSDIEDIIEVVRGVLNDV